MSINAARRASAHLSTEAFKDLGYSVVAAGSAFEALRLLESGQRFDLLFADIVMSDMNGRQLADKAIALRPPLKVLYNTGYRRNAVVHNGVFDPGTAFLQKPFTVGQLASKHAQALTIGRERSGRWGTVKLMPPAYVKPYVKSQKNDSADAEAICKAVTRPNMRFAEVKSVEQQSVFNRDLVSEHEGEGYLCRINRPDTWARRPPSVMRDFPCQQGVYRSTRITLTPMIQQHVTMVAIILNGLRFAMTARDV